MAQHSPPPLEEEEVLFVLSVTLSNSQQYTVEVVAGMSTAEQADRFCMANGMGRDPVLKRELTLLLEQYLREYS